MIGEALPVSWFPIVVLGVWRIVHLLVAEDGPWDLAARLREAVGSGFWGGLLDCFACLSLWASVPFALTMGTTWLQWAVLWLALSGAAVLLEGLATWAGEPPPARYVEDLPEAEDSDDMLRK
jgi:hypothetical protein